MNHLLKSIAVVLAAATQFATSHAAGHDPDRRKQYDISLCSSYNRGDATDTSWNAKPGTLQGNATVTSGTRYLTLDGTGDYVDHGDDPEWTYNLAGQDQAFSVSAWVYLAATPSGNIAIVAKASSGTTYEWALRASSGAGAYPQFIVLNTTASAYRGRRLNSALSSGQWYHIVGTYSGTEATTGLKIYINGVQSDTNDVTAGSYTGMSDTASPLTVGSAVGAEYLNGRVDDTRIYQRALTDTEVAILYSSGRTLP